MNTPANDAETALQAVSVRFSDTMVYVLLSDHREVGLPLGHPRLRWLAAATSEQRSDWLIEATGRVVVWDALDEGLEVEHLLRAQPFS